MGRYIFNGLTGLSLVICLATVPLWIGASDRATLVDYYSGSRCYSIAMRWSGIEYSWCPDHGPLEWRVLRLWLRRHGNGFRYERSTPGQSGVIGLPYWFICLVSALAPSMWVTARLRHRRCLPGHCSKCGYDLRATTNRCPECGTIVDLAPKTRGSATEDTEHTEEEKEKSPQMRH